ncbi:MAG: hypothetical protein R3E66_20310 [bacterium]
MTRVNGPSAEPSWGLSNEGDKEFNSLLQDAYATKTKLSGELHAAEASGDTEGVALLRKEIAYIEGQISDVVRLATSGGSMEQGPLAAKSKAFARGLDEIQSNTWEPSGATSAKDLNEATGTSPAGTGDASNASASTVDDGGLMERVVTMDAGELAKEFGADPKGMWDKLSTLNPEDRQFALMKLQQGVQENNQLFSMLTNFMKATHDTEKAIVSNLRV